jgi:hypothetical protein
MSPIADARRFANDGRGLNRITLKGENMSKHGTDFYDQIQTTEPQARDEDETNEADADERWEEFRELHCLDQNGSSK